MMLPGSRGRRGMSEIRILNLDSNIGLRTLQLVLEPQF